MFQKARSHCLRALVAVALPLTVVHFNANEAMPSLTVGSGTRTSENRSLPQFDKLELHIPVEFNIRRGDKITCVLSGDDNIIPLISTVVTDRCLQISATGGYAPRQKLFVTIDVPVLKGIVSDAPGKIAVGSRVLRAGTGRVEVVSKSTASITIADVNAENLLVVSNGTGGITIADVTAKKVVEVVKKGTENITMTHLAADRLLIKSNATGVMTAKGKVKELSAILEGTERLKLAGLESAKAEITHSGTGVAEVWVTETLTAEASGTGNIMYSGSPSQIHSSGDGPGKVIKK